jgi:CubicO group peptidase (beta-lactamase class C family)
MTETDPDRRPPAAGEATSGRAPRRRIIALAAATLTAVTLAVLTPWPRGFQGTPTGDAELMSELAQTLGSKHWQHIAAARIDGDEVTFAGTGADEHTEFEIGSITKTFTAALFADAIDRGEIDADTRLGEVWPDLHGKVAEVSLESIAQQRSGLPSQKPWSGWGEGLSGILANYVRADPYRGDAAAIVAGLRPRRRSGRRSPSTRTSGSPSSVRPSPRSPGRTTASSCGRGSPNRWAWRTPFVPDSPEGLSPRPFTSSGLSGRPVGHGRLTRPAGAIRSTAHDMSIWLRAVRDGTAPGAEAAEPRTDFDDSDRIGWAWFTTKTGARTSPGTTEAREATGPSSASPRRPGTASSCSTTPRTGSMPPQR